MKIREALKKGIELLKTANIETPALEAGVMLCYALRCDRSYLYVYGENMLQPEEEALFFEIAEKRAQGVPLQYLTGEREFMSLNFHVAPGVLIPRHETEVLVETVIQYVGQAEQAVEILDIGTGSGCISVSLASYMKNCRVVAVDISEDALRIAKRNADSHGVGERITFIQSDLFGSLADRKFDCIVSNPPYIPSGEIAGLSVDVREHEPRIALDGGSDGLDFYRKIIEKAPVFLKDGGRIFFEVGFGQAEGVGGMLSGCFRNIEIYKDLAGIGRVVCGQWKP